MIFIDKLDVRMPEQPPFTRVAFSVKGEVS